MSDLRIDFDRLDRAAERVTVVLADLEGAGELSTRAADAAGHAEVRSAIHDFRGGWAVRRERIVGELRFVHDSAIAMRDTFRELDRDLADRVNLVTTELET